MLAMQDAARCRSMRAPALPKLESRHLSISRYVHLLFIRRRLLQCPISGECCARCAVHGHARFELAHKVAHCPAPHGFCRAFATGRKHEFTGQARLAEQLQDGRRKRNAVLFPLALAALHIFQRCNPNGVGYIDLRPRRQADRLGPRRGSEREQDGAGFRRLPSRLVTLVGGGICRSRFERAGQNAVMTPTRTSQASLANLDQQGWLEISACLTQALTGFDLKYRYHWLLLSFSCYWTFSSFEINTLMLPSLSR